MKKILILIIPILFIFNEIKAQELPIFQQYMQNFYYISPAAIGIKPCKEAVITDRHQWTGIKHAPNTQGLGLYGRFNVFSDKKVGYEGLGLTLFSDNNGPSSVKRIQLAFAHHITLMKINRRKKLKMSFGLAASYFQYRLNETDLVASNPNDPLLTGAVNSSSFFNFDAGILIYTTKFTAGFTAAQLIPSSISYYNSQNTLEKHYFGFVSYKKVNRDGMGYAPSIVFKTTNTSRQLDLNTKIYINKMFNLGLSYRRNFDKLMGSSISGMFILGVNISNYTFGYAYETSLSRIGRHNYGTHDIMLAYKICQPQKHACPAYW